MVSGFQDEVFLRIMRGLRRKDHHRLFIRPGPRPAVIFIPAR